MSKGYTPLPDVLIDHIESKEWQILEMCGGNGYNAQKLKDKNIDNISFDIAPNDTVKYGVSGTIEYKYPTRTLLLCSAMEATLSVREYQGGGGGRVILGGYLIPINLKTDEEIYVIDNMVTPVIKPIKIYNYVESLQSKANGYFIDVRPNPGWMKKNGWKLVDTFYGPSDEKEQSIPLRIFQIWEYD